MPKVIKIESIMQKKKELKKVAAYARVSMETDKLHHSLSAQVKYYSSLIQKNPKWEYAGVYADEGITGTSIKHRTEFQRLMKDCEQGKIDIILVKSISRFARDTVDCLNSVRKLKTMDIDVYFERENINSISSEGELLLTLLASFAQEESRSISDNVRWGIHKNFEKGISNCNKPPFGYRWDGDMFRVVEEQGQIVKEMYRRYLGGESAYSIAKDMANRGIRNHSGKLLEEATVKDILTNISYTGTRILQKYYIAENKVRKTNKGELPKYLIEGMYEPLISEEDYKKAVEIRKKRAEDMPNKNPEITPLSGLIKCGACGCGVSRRKSTKRWICNTVERRGKSVCRGKYIMEEELVSAAKSVLGKDNYTREAALKTIKKVLLYGDRIEFFLRNGKKQIIKRKYDIDFGISPFRSRVFCGECNSICKRQTWSKQEKVWICKERRHKCKIRKITEKELIEACKFFLGEEYEGKLVEYVDKIFIMEKSVRFKFYDGRMKIWQRR